MHYLISETDFIRGLGHTLLVPNLVNSLVLFQRGHHPPHCCFLRFLPFSISRLAQQLEMSIKHRNVLHGLVGKVLLPPLLLGSFRCDEVIISLEEPRVLFILQFGELWLLGLTPMMELPH